MSFNNDYYRKAIKDSNNKFKIVVCPYLENNRCTIYGKRFACCKNFPQATGYCSKSSCAILVYKIYNNSEMSSRHCEECPDNCCRHIAIPENLVVNKDSIIPWLDMDCETCMNCYR